MSPMLELQGAIITRLKTNTLVASICDGRVYDHVPRGPNGDITARFPFVAIGASDEVQDDADCIVALEMFIDIEVWSRSVGFPEARELTHAVRLALHDHDLNLSTNALVFFQHRQTRTFRDPDGITSHAVLGFEAVAEQR